MSHWERKSYPLAKKAFQCSFSRRAIGFHVWTKSCIKPAFWKSGNSG